MKFFPSDTTWSLTRLAAGAVLALGAGFTTGCADTDMAEESEHETLQLAVGDTSCCAEGEECYCRSEQPSITSRNGTYRVSRYTIPRSSQHGGGTVYYPGDVEGKFSGAVFCPPFTGSQMMYAAWGPFLASHGISLVTMDTRSVMDSVQSRGTQLAAMVAQYRGEATRAGSPINGKLDAQRIGTMGWSMGGGATWIAANKDKTLKSSISFAGHNLTGGGAGNSRATTVPSLQLAGQADTGILGGMGQSQGVYNIIPASTPKMLYVVRGVGHMSWGSPNAPTATAGGYMLAWEKAFLDGDQRWKALLKQKPANASEWKTNVQ